MDLSVDFFAVDFAVDFVVDCSVEFVFVDFLGRGFCYGFFCGFSSTVVVDLSFAVFRAPLGFPHGFVFKLVWIHSARLENVAF